MLRFGLVLHRRVIFYVEYQVHSRKNRRPKALPFKENKSNARGRGVEAVEYLLSHDLRRGGGGFHGVPVQIAKCTGISS